ncbi:hypothetical protein JNUCC64_16910 [Streptomyces sp. JNUCC 64]
METGALLIALIGVCGTLAATWLTQRSADRAKRKELDHAVWLHRAEREDRAREETLGARRTSHVALNTTARQYLTALSDRLHELRLGAPGDEGAAEVEKHRAVYRESYAQAQMVVPDEVLAAAGRSNAALSGLHGLLKRLANGTAREGESLETAGAGIDAARDLLHELREVMRTDLGIAGPSGPPARARSLPPSHPDDGTGTGTG